MAQCESDVRLLKEGCLTSKRLFEAKTGFNPFEHMTIASACNRDLRMNCMIPNSLARESTDSVIYLEPGQPNPPLGDYLGEFTRELDADRLHRGIRGERPQELWVQNQERQSQMQGPRLPSQHRGQNPIKI